MMAIPLVQCPECRTELVFTPDGRARYCERCGYRHEVAVPPRTSIAELEKALSFMNVRQMREEAPNRPQQAGLHRDLLVHGIAAAKEGRADEAFFHLSRVLKAANSSNGSRATAWLWLSAVVDDPAEKRRCLENVLVLDPAQPEARRGLAILDGRLDAADIINPDRLPEPDAGQQQAAEAAEMRCPRCGARMTYAPEIGALQCDFCHFRQPLDQEPNQGGGRGVFADREEDFIAALATARGHRRPVHMRTLMCRRCAVTFVLGPETLSLTCPYCDSVYVTEAAEEADLMPPHGLIPFAVDESQAEQRLRAWFREHHLDNPRRSSMAGLYLPVWTFDIHGPLKWSCLVRQGDEWVTRTGQDYVLFDDYLVPAVGNLPAELVEHLAEFDLAGLVDYDARYLADWPAERYQLPLAEASLKARGAIMGQLRRSPSRYVGSNNYRNFKLSASGGLTVLAFRLVLLPLWLVHYQVDDRSYEIMINGQRGSVHGSRPQSLAGRFISWLAGN
jgi:hypothetical protein